MKKVWEGLMDLIFEEEDDDVIVSEIEDVPFTDINLISPKAKQEKTEVPPVSYEKEKAMPKTELITIHPTLAPASSVPSRSKPVEPEVAVEPKTAYEFTKVISPIYGTRENINSKVDESALARHSSAKYKSALGTVISPIYSNAEENPNINEVEVEGQLVDLKVDDFISDNFSDFESPNVVPVEMAINTPIQNTFTDLTLEMTPDVINMSLFDDEEQ